MISEKKKTLKKLETGQFYTQKLNDVLTILDCMQI